MNPSPHTGSTLPGGSDGAMHRPKPPANWREALMTLIAARATLIQIEAKDASKTAARFVALLSAAGACAFFAWALLLAGGISWLSESTGWPWNRLALAAAALHAIAVFVLVRIVKSPSEPTFPVTRAEFQKDREWIENLQKTSKSHD